MAKAAQKTASETNAQDNVVRGIQFGRGATDEASFLKDFQGQGSATDRIFRFLEKQQEIAKRERATVINMIALPEMREAIALWPYHAESDAMRKLITEKVFDTSERGKALNAQIDQLAERAKSEKGQIQNDLSNMRTKRSYIIGKMVDARKTVKAVKEAEENGFILRIAHNDPNILVAHSSDVLKMKQFTSGGLMNVPSFVGKTDVSKLAERGTNDKGAKIAFRNGTAMLATIKAMSAHFAKWAEEPKKHGITAEVQKELSVLLANIHEILNVDLTASQKSALEEIEATADEKEEKKEAQTS